MERERKFILDNRATPKYYGQFREAVREGRIPVNLEISLEMNRIDARIADPNIYYCEESVEGYISFCNEELVLTDGSPLELLDTFKLWAEQLLGWFYYVDRSVYVPSPDHRGGRYVRKKILKRLINIQYLIIARGNSKSFYMSTIQNYYLAVDKSTSHQITVAPTMIQADEVMNPIKTSIIRARGPLMQFLTEGSINNTTGSKAKKVKYQATKLGIQNFITGSILQVRPMTIDKLQGLRTKINTIDEWLSCDIRENPIETIAQGAAKIPNWLLLAASSEGTIRNGVGDTIKMELQAILRGEYNDPSVSIFWYKLDSLDEINDPAMIPKCSPNIGATVSWDTYAQAKEKAEKFPMLRNDIVAKRYGIPMEGYTYFFTYEETKLHKKRSYRNMSCILGADMSQGDDFCAFTYLFPLRGEMYGVKTINFISEKTLMALHPALREAYNQFVDEGTLIVMPGITLDMVRVYEDVYDHTMSMGYNVQGIGYDPYNAQEFIDRWMRIYGTHSVIKVPQGVKTESVPLGEIKDLMFHRAILFDEQIMTFAIGNCVVMENNNGGRMIMKRRQDRKIDPVAAMMDAYIAYKQLKDYF